LTCLARLARVVRRVNPDLIHASLFHANLACRLVARLDRPRPLITSTVTIELERNWHLWLEAATMGLSDLHVANSNAVAAHLRKDLGFPANRLCMIRNGLDLRSIDAVAPIDRLRHGIASNQKLIVWAGRMDPVKELPVLIETVERLRADFDVRAVLLGDGPCRAAVENLIRSHHLSNVIATPGWSDDVIGWLKSADLLLFPSMTEGSPNVVLEAMACGCPVVASDIPACRELMDDNVSGRLIHHESPGNFARAVSELLTDSAKSKALAHQASNVVEQRHEIHHIARQWADLYRRLLG
jgi:glycosyltransferase involved in cell wall biosynthesis